MLAEYVIPASVSQGAADMMLTVAYHSVSALGSSMGTLTGTSGICIVAGGSWERLPCSSEVRVRGQQMSQNYAVCSSDMQYCCLGTDVEHTGS